MDSSNAEKAWEEHRSNWPMTSSRESFDAGIASRDAEVAELTRLLAESRAANGDSEARRAELEAALDAVRMRHHAKTIQTGSSTHGGPQQFGEVCSCGMFGCNLYRIIAVPSVVLEDRDRENRAIGWDEGERHESEYLSTYGQFCPGGHCNPYRGDTR